MLRPDVPLFGACSFLEPDLLSHKIRVHHNKLARARALTSSYFVATNLCQKRISRLRRLLKGGAAAAQRAAAAKAPVEAGGEAFSLEGVQGGTDGTTAAPGAPSPPPTGQQHELRLSPTPSITAAASNKSSKQLKPSTFSSRTNEINSRGVQAAMAKLETIGSDLKAEGAWAVDDRNPGGGMHEFRAAVFDKKLDRFFKRCEEAHEEADAVSEAYLLLVDRGR